jgi:hypothetical protein
VLASTTTPGAFGVKINNAAGLMTGQVLFKVLEKFGRVSTAYSSVLTTVNRQSVPVGVLNTLSYLKSITPATTQSTTGGTSLSSGVGLVPGEITTGFSLNLLPMVLDSNRVLLQCTISISKNRLLKNYICLSRWRSHRTCSSLQERRTAQRYRSSTLLGELWRDDFRIC